MINELKNKLLSDFSLHAVTSFLCGMLGAIVVVIIVQLIHKPAPIIATVNITQIVDQFIRDAQQKNIPQNILEKETKQFGEKLEANLKQLAIQNNLVLLPKEAVIAGSVDYTDFVKPYVMLSQKENVL